MALFGKSAKRRGLELLLFGGITVAAGWILAPAAAIGIAAYGAYRWAVGRSTLTGMAWLGAAVGTYFLANALSSVVLYLGGAMILSGVGLVALPFGDTKEIEGEKVEEEGKAEGPVIEIEAEPIDKIDSQK